jgi:DNA processing protein
MPREPSEIPRAEWSLAAADGVGPVEGQRLLDAIGSAEGVVGASRADLAAVLGEVAGARVHAALGALDLDRELRRMEQLGVRGLLPGDPDWPPLLAAIHGAPLGLWVRGSFVDADRFSVAVVGSRACSAYGLEQADRLAGWLAEQGFTIVSGGARGIDAAAHRSALRHSGRTVAVLAGGLGCPYPPEHEPLYREIVEAGGCVCSEFPCDHPSRPGLFPRRNRIISGLSIGTLLVEARHDSGALITGRMAAEEHGREVMAVPGRVDGPWSAGCHRAIREGWASLVTCVGEVTEQLRASPLLVAAAVRSGGAGSGPRHTPVQQAVLEAVRQTGQLDIDRLAEASGLGVAEILAAVTMLELSGVRLR